MRKMLGRAAALGATLTLLSASAVAATPGSARSAETSRSCENGEFAVTVRLPATSAMGAVQMVVHEANKPC